MIPDPSQIIENVWSPANPKTAANERRLRTDLRLWLATQDGLVVEALTRNPEVQWETDDMRKLELTLLDAFPSKRRIALMGCLYRVVRDWRNRTGMKCSFPRKVWKSKRSSNPLRFDLERNLRRHRQIRQDLLDAVKKLPQLLKQKADPDYLATAILSGIVHFGILHKDVLLATISALTTPKSSFLAINKCVCLSLSLPVRGVPNAEQRLWIPDPLSATLLLKVDPQAAKSLLSDSESRSASQEETERLILGKLSERIQNLVGTQEDGSLGYSLEAILKTCVRASTASLPFSVIAYQTRRVISHSLRPSVLARLEPKTILLSHDYPGEGAVPIDLLKEEDLSLLPLIDREAKSPDSDNRLNWKVGEKPNWYPHLAGALSGSHLAVIRRRLEALQKHANLPEIAKCIAGFAFILARPRGSTPLSPGTLRKYVSLLSRFLAPQIGDEEDMMSKIGEDVYVEAIEDHGDSTAGGSLSSRQLFAVLLLRFHNYLIDKHQAKPFDDIHAFVAGCLPVDANIVSVEELFQILEAIRNTRLIPEAQKIQAQLLVILGYHGLRRNEASFLRCCDIDVGSPTYALIRNTAERRVKTRNAIRRVNLDAFLPQKVLVELLRYRCQRLGCVNSRCNGKCKSTFTETHFLPLFVPDNNAFLNDDDLFAKIHEIMRATVKDQKVRFHSLRHSLASLLILSLLAGQSKIIGDLLPSRKRTRLLIQSSSSLRRRIYGTDQVSWTDLFLVANWIGHGSPKTTLTHYCHTLFAVAAAFTANNRLKLDEIKALSSASGRSQSTVYRNGRNFIPFRIFKKRFDMDIKALARKRAGIKKAAKSQKPQPSSSKFERSLRFGELFLDRSLPLQDVIERSGIGAERGAAIVRSLGDLLSESKKRRR